jgi:aminoglycoside phosphotransferase
MSVTPLLYDSHQRQTVAAEAPGGLVCDSPGGDCACQARPEAQRADASPDIERADGSLEGHVAVDSSSTRSPAADAAREYEVLRVVEAAGVPAPRTLLLDAEGDYFGAPAIVLSYLPGRPIFPTTTLGPWTEGLAGGALDIHSVKPDSHDISFLEAVDRDHMLVRIHRRREDRSPDPFIEEMRRVLVANRERIELLPFTLIHADYWSGNTIWFRGRFAGIVDWSDAKVGDPRADVAEVRLDLAIGYGVEVADQFAAAYERLAGEPIRDLWFFDLTGDESDSVVRLLDRGVPRYRADACDGGGSGGTAARAAGAGDGSGPYALGTHPSLSGTKCRNVSLRDANRQPSGVRT